MNHWVFIIGSIAIFYFLSKFEDKHSMSLQEMTGNYRLSSAVTPFVIGIIFLSMAIVAESIWGVLFSFIYFFWSALQIFRALRKNN